MNSIHRPGPRPPDSHAFRAFFEGSKVVDAQGLPLVVYHGTPTHGEHSNNKYVRMEQAGVEYPAFDVFDTAGGGHTDSGWLGRGAYFTPDPDYAYEFGNFLIPAYVALRNPFFIHDDATSSRANNLRFLQSLQSLKGLPEQLRLDLSLPEDRIVRTYSGESFHELFALAEVTDQSGEAWHALISGQTRGLGVICAKGKTPEEAIFAYRYGNRYNWFLSAIVQEIGASRFRELLIENGYDGVIELRDPYEKLGEAGPQISEVVAFRPEQIKSALGNCGTFAAHRESILLRESGTQTPTADTAAFRDWFGNSRFVDEKGAPMVVYRGERSGLDFSVFDPTQMSDRAFFFTPDEEYATWYSLKGPPRSFYLRAERILDLRDPEDPAAIAFVRDWAKAWDPEGWIDRRSGEEVDALTVIASGELWDYEGDCSLQRWRDLQGSIEIAGYDGAILPDSNSRTAQAVCIVFRADQIKSADRNSGEFSRSTPDIFLRESSAAAGPEFG